MSKKPTAAKRTQRTRSQQQKIDEEMTELEAKRNVIVSKIRMLENQFNDDAIFGNWSKGDLEERKAKLQDLSGKLELNELDMTCKDELSNEDKTENATLDNLCMSLKAKATNKIDEILSEKIPQIRAQAANAEQQTIRVIQTDAAGNLPNTWGTFAGDYAKWQSFRDRWMPIHKNKEVLAVTKFQALKAACIGEAAGALGEWDITEANYLKAFKRLSAIYENDYMQTQAYMHKLIRMPRMKDNSAKAVRQMLDAVQQHIAGVNRYIKIDENHPYAVFSVIDKMDSDTFRAWEKHRPSLTKANARQIDPNDNNDDNAEADETENQDEIPLNLGKHIPTWKELEEFLEGEVTIRVHEERRHETDKQSFQRNQAKQNKANFANKNSKQFKRQDAKPKSYPSYVVCGACDGNHPTTQCETFKTTNLLGKKQIVCDKDLCEKCLRKNHSGPCENNKCNVECPRCKPGIKFHNSLLCPNIDQNARSVMLTNTSGSRKRKGNKNEHQRNNKRRRGANDNQMQSVVHKVGDWKIPAQSNAVSHNHNKIKANFDGEYNYTVLLATMNIIIQTGTNYSSNCRAISDTGATINCVSKQFVDVNALPTKKCQRAIIGVSGPEILKRKVSAYIHPWFDNKKAVAAELYVLNSLEGNYPYQKVNVSKDEIRNFILADPNFDEPAPVDALLGAEVYCDIIGTDLYKHKDGAIMQSTEFGHIILGKFRTEKTDNAPVLSITDNLKQNDDCIAKALAKFWQIEEINKNEIDMNLNEEEQACEDLFQKTHFRENTGRYVVTIPINNNKTLGDSRSIAYKQFIQQENRLEKDPETKAKYIEYMNKFLAKGYMQKANEKYDPKNAYWLPHHAVKRKFRVVVNASQKTTSGESLNSIQMTGPKIQHDLALQLMRFRKHEIAFVTDISEMFNKIGLNEKQWNLQRLFWRESPSDPLMEYVITVVMFGLKSSPFNAQRTLKQCAKDFEARFPEAAKAITSCFYMDDGLFGAENLQKAKLLCKEIEFVLNSANFTLKSWASNSPTLEGYMNKNASSNENIILGENDETKVLGITWNKATDEEGIFVKQLSMQNKITKRSILRETATLYDPNGFIAPVIVKAKMLMQDIWRLNTIDWDDEVPEEIKTEWLQFYTSLPFLSQFKKKRWLCTKPESEIQIHAFCDASEKAYGTAIYVRVVDEKKQISCTLLSSKSRVAPLKTVSIPRLELLAAVMLCEQLEAILKAMEFQNVQVTMYSDSICVLHWINKQPADLKAFVANRIALIQEKSKDFTWKHVKSADNPADLVSRGMSIQDFLTSKKWIEGPEWLMQPEETWPKAKMIVTNESREAIIQECKQKAEKIEVGIFKIGPCNDRKPILYQYNSWSKVVNVTAYALRYMNNLNKNKESISGRYLFAHERNKAVEFWVKYEQKFEFKKEIECLKAKEALPAKSKIASLRPMLDANGTVRVGGRIDKASLPYAKRHQYIIPHKSRLAYLLLRYAHEATLHGGVQLMTYFLRKAFWIPKLRQEAKHYIKTCVHCVKHAQLTANQIMAELPSVRIIPAPPFLNVGVDMAGPYNMLVSDKMNLSTRNRQMPEMKGWIAIFVCLVTRAVHLEATDGLSTDDFLSAYQRFVDRRGHPENIYSDNGTNFVGTDRELSDAFRTWQNEKIQHYANERGTKWHYITPSAPHQGGLWEAAVKATKHHLNRVSGTQKYSFRGMSTLLASIEACLNSRPLCALTDDVDDFEALSPAHFLIGRSLRLPLPERLDAPNPKSLKRLFVQTQFQIQAFWRQWSDDYLQALTQLPKWKKEYENVRIGQLVLIKNTHMPPSYWAMGRITQVHNGSDGKVRSVTLKTQSGQFDRPITKLCILPTDIELQYWNNAEKKQTE